jgi:DNA-damage-inducible protein J
MAKSAMIRARTEPEVKKKAEAIIHALGLNPTTVITMLYRQIIRLRGLPFEPNTTTLAAMRAAESDHDLIRAGSVDELMDLLADDEGPEDGTPTGRNKAVQKRRESNQETRMGHGTSR